MLEGKFLTLKGLKIFTNIFGNGEPLIFLHGGPGGEHRYFLPHLQDLSNHFTLIFYDQRGCGQSETLENYTMDGEVETLEALREHLGIEKLNLIGESWGSMLSLLYAVKYPNRVNKIFMTAAVGATIEAFQRFEKELLKRLPIEERQLLDELSKKLASGEIEVGKIFNIIAPYYVYSTNNLSKKTPTKSNPVVNQMISKDIMENYNLSNEAEKLKNIPILVAQGDHDIISPAILDEVLIKFIPHIEVYVLDKCGHWSVIEQSSKLQALIKDFFEKN